MIVMPAAAACARSGQSADGSLAAMTMALRLGGDGCLNCRLLGGRGVNGSTVNHTRPTVSRQMPFAHRRPQ